MKLTIEIANAANARWRAPFLQRELRGRWDYARVKEPLAATCPPIPGQCLSIDTDRRQGKIIEPLHAPKLDELRRRLAAKLTPGSLNATLGLDPAEQVIELKDPRDVPTWPFWMKRAVESGIAKVVDGRLPTDDECHGARKRFEGTEETPEELLKRQQLAVQMALMTPEQRKEYDRLMAGGK